MSIVYLAHPSSRLSCIPSSHSQFSPPSFNEPKTIALTDRTLSVLTTKLRYLQLQDWQITLTKSILDGKDVIFTAGTGCGKTTLLYALLLAFHLEEPTAMALSITPMKALGRDQVRCSFCFLCWLTEIIPGTLCPFEGNSCRCH